MRAVIVALGLLVLALLPSSSPIEAGREVPTRSSQARLELLVLEVDSQQCTICGLVRRHVLPRYLETPHARTVPIRFVDITRLDERTLGLDAPVSIVPTVVLLRDGREVERITGYFGPENFMTMIGQVLRTATD